MRPASKASVDSGRSRTPRPSISSAHHEVPISDGAGFAAWPERHPTASAPMASIVNTIPRTLMRGLLRIGALPPILSCEFEVASHSTRLYLEIREGRV